MLRLALLSVAFCVIFSGCGSKPHIAERTAQALIIDTPVLALTMLGVWQPDPAAKQAQNVIYAVLRQDGGVTRNFSVCECPVAADINVQDRREQFEAFLKNLLENEDLANGRREQFTVQPVVQQGELLVGGYLAVHAGAGRCGYSQTVWNRQRGFTFYYEVTGLQGVASPKHYGEEFNEIMKTARLK